MSSLSSLVHIHTPASSVPSRHRYFSFVTVLVQRVLGISHCIAFIGSHKSKIPSQSGRPCISMVTWCKQIYVLHVHPTLIDPSSLLFSGHIHLYSHCIRCWFRVCRRDHEEANERTVWALKILTAHKALELVTPRNSSWAPDASNNLNAICFQKPN